MGAYFSWVFRRSVLQRVGLYDNTLSQAEDRDLFERVKSAGYSFGLVAQTLWYHRRGETTTEFLRSIVTKGRRRVNYIIKNRLWLDFAKGTGGMFVLLLLLVLGIFDVIFLLVLGLVIVAGFAYRYWEVFRLGRRTEASTSGLLALPIFQALRYLANSLGYMIGLSDRILGRGSKSLQPAMPVKASGT